MAPCAPQLLGCTLKELPGNLRTLIYTHVAVHEGKKELAHQNYLSFLTAVFNPPLRYLSLPHTHTHTHRVVPTLIGSGLGHLPLLPTTSCNGYRVGKPSYIRTT